MLNKHNTALIGVRYFLSILFIMASAQISAEEKINAVDNIAMDGFDVVAYFTEAKPTKGDSQYSVDYKDKQWLFSNADNAEMFKQEPTKYEPQFNGWCAYAVSKGYAAEVDFINGWSIFDDKLYLNWNAEVSEIFAKKHAKRISKAEKNWPKVRDGLLDGSTDFYTHEQEKAEIAHPQQL